MGAAFAYQSQLTECPERGVGKLVPFQPGARVIRLLVALVMLSPMVTASAADQMASIRVAVERCRTEQAAQPARIGPVKEGGFFKQQELDARYRLETPITASPNQATTAFVEVATTIARATASPRKLLER